MLVFFPCDCAGMSLVMRSLKVQPETETEMDWQTKEENSSQQEEHSAAVIKHQSPGLIDAYPRINIILTYEMHVTKNQIGSSKT